MREHRDTIQRLSIILDDDPRQYQLYASRLENKVKARKVQKIAFADQRYWAYYDVNGVTLILNSDTSTGVSLHADDSHDELLRTVAERISSD